MKDYAIAAFLGVFGITELLTTTLPKWITPLVALVAVVAIVLDKSKD